MNRTLIVILGGFLFLFAGCSREQRQIPSNGLCLWLKADAGVTLNGSTVTRWADQSGNGNHAIQMDAERRPRLVQNVLNGRPVIRFDGRDDRLGLTGTKRMSQVSLFIVFKIDSGLINLNAYFPIVLGNIVGDGQTFGLGMHNGFTGNSLDIISVTSGLDCWVRATTPGCARFGQWKSLSVITDHLIKNTAMRVNGANASITPVDVNISISVPLGNPNGTGVGGIGGADGVRLPPGRLIAKCDVAEVIIYDTVLPDSLRRSVEEYLGRKYRLPPAN